MSTAAQLEKILGSKKRKSVSDLALFIANKNDKTAFNFCFLLGAGASRSSGIRTGRELVKIWRDHAYKTLAHSNEADSDDTKIAWLTANSAGWYDPSKEYSALFEHIYTIRKQRRIFIENEVAGRVPSIGYAYLVRLTEAHHTRTIFTTNFDDLLNEAFYQFSSERPIVCAHDSSIRNASITSHRPRVIKLHGDYLFDGIKATANETQQLELNIKEKLLEFLREYGLIVSGYSGCDRSVMQPLIDMLDRGELGLGLFWCFRTDEKITPDVVELLKRDQAFYVIVDGFDELMAELHKILCGDQLPFNSKIASDRASKVITSYLDNPHLSCSQSGIIKTHLEELARERKSSLVVEAIRELRTAESSDGLTDSELLIYFEIQRLLRARNYEGASMKILAELENAKSDNFQQALLERLYLCYQRMYKMPEALATADRMIRKDPTNFFATINKCDAISAAETRMAILKDAYSRAPYTRAIVNRLSLELINQYESPTTLETRPKPDDVRAVLKKSLEIGPSIENIAWLRLYDFESENEPDKKKCDSALKQIIDEHLKQNAYHSKTLGFILKFCVKNESREYSGRDIFTYFDEAFERHFPKDYAAHFIIYSDACIEFDEHEKLRTLIQRCALMPELEADEDFVHQKMLLQHNYYRDLEGAVTTGLDFLKSHPSRLIEEQVLEYLIASGDIERSEAALEKLKGLLPQNEFTRKRAAILELQNRFQDSIDCIESIPEKDGFLEKNTAHIAFLFLKMKEFDKARHVCKTLLDKHNFSLNFQVEIINYEYAKIRLGRSPSPVRLRAISDLPKTKVVKGVALLLLGEKEIAFRTLEAEGRKRFSEIGDYLKWPVLEELHPRLDELRLHLLSTKRTPEWLSVRTKVIDV